MTEIMCQFSTFQAFHVRPDALALHHSLKEHLWHGTIHLWGGINLESVQGVGNIACR